jgi:predicted DNA-binding ribbon-helix-helix protein
MSVESAKDVHFSVRLESENYEDLKRIAAVHQWTKGQVIRNLIKTFGQYLIPGSPEKEAAHERHQ